MTSVKWLRNKLADDLHKCADRAYHRKDYTPHELQHCFLVAHTMTCLDQLYPGIKENHHHNHHSDTFVVADMPKVPHHYKPY